MKDLKHKLIVLFIAIVSVNLFSSCEKDDDIPSIRSVVTSPMDYSVYSEIRCGGTVIFDRDLIIERGVCWSTSPNPTITDSRTIDGRGNGSFISKITDLEPNTFYYVRAYAITKYNETQYAANENRFITGN